MEWKKTKNVIILLLALTNLFLMSFVVRELSEKERQEVQARELAVLFLTDRGISLSSELVPTEMTHQPMELAWNRTKEVEWSRALLGEVSEENLGGGVFRYYGEKGELRFHTGGEFYGEFKAFETQGQRDQFGIETLFKLGFEGKFISSETTEKGEILHFVQLLNGVPLLGCQATLIFEGEYLTSISYGKQLQGDYTPTAQKTITIPTALMKIYEGMNLLGDAYLEITAIDSVFLASTKLSGSAVVIPAWQVETDTGTYYLDLTSGMLSRA